MQMFEMRQLSCEYTVVNALMANMEELILDRIAFGSVEDP